MSIDNNPNKQLKNRQNTLNRRARAIGATLMLAGGAATGLLLANNAKDATPVKPQETTTEAPATTNEQIMNEVSLNERFSKKAASFIEALNSDTSGNIQKTQLVPNDENGFNYRGQGGFIQFSYIGERDGMTAVVNVIASPGLDQETPDPNSIVEFDAKLTTPGAVPPTDDNPLGNVDMYSVRFQTGEGPAALSGILDGEQFRLDQADIDANDPNFAGQLDSAWNALDSIEAALVAQVAE